MALTFLELTNDVIVRMNEVVLTSSDFSASRGIQTQCKNAVNDAIRYINQREFGYSFNHASNSSTLTPGVAKYSLPSSTKSVDYSTARIKRNTTLGSTGNNLINRHGWAGWGVAGYGGVRRGMARQGYLINKQAWRGMAR